MKRLVALVDGQAGEVEGRLARFESLAQWLGDVRDQLMRPANDDAEIRRLKSAAAAALADGEFETAMDALRIVRRELREARRRTEERLHEEATALRTQMAEEARATARLAELLSARGEHAQAAELFAEAAMALPRADRDSALRFNLRRAEALLQHARERGDGPSLSEALSAYGSLVRQVAETANAKALAEACLGHGEALCLAGERDPASNRLKDAIAIYQKAIQLLDRERDQAGVRRARIALAKALVRQGERDGSVESLRDAAQAFRDAANSIAPDKLPSEYASVHMNLGAVLLAIEEREGGKAPLVEAADAYRKAIARMDSEADGERWSEAQMNLGLALLGMGEQEKSAAQLDEAVVCFRAVLESTPRVMWPRRWALTQMNLGNALAAIGERDEKSTAFLEEAIVAYNMALEELLREAEPLKWAITQMNLGTALIRLGERKDRRRHWLTAAAAMVPALEVFEELSADGLAEVTRRNLKRLQESWDSFLAPPGSAEAAAEPKSGLGQPRLAQAG
jgi:tetratricopeptide (TPR) repeat protein